MDEKTKLLVCLGAANAANCLPCYEHYYQLALEAGLGAGDISTAAELGEQMKRGASMNMKRGVNQITGGDTGQKESCCSPSVTSCNC